MGSDRQGGHRATATCSKTRRRRSRSKQQSRIVKSEDVIDQLLAEQYALYNENPQNLDVVRKIASLHEDKDDLEGALQYYQWAVEVTKGGDPGLVRKVNDLTMKNLDRRSVTREQWLDEDQSGAANGATDEEARRTIAPVRRRTGRFQAQKAEMLINTARERVERNPTDLNFRYELGDQLVKAGQYTEAIAELQKAQNSPNLGLKAKYLLGQCFEAKNILPPGAQAVRGCARQAAEHGRLEERRDLPLGLVYERSGEKEKYLACMTEIYEVDSAFQDVAARVEGGYAM